MKLHFIVIACLVLPGCARYTPRASTPIKFYLRQVNDELSSANWLAKYNSMPSATASDQALKAAERNRLLNEFVWIIDNSYGKFETSFYSGKATEDIAGDFLQLGLTGAAALSAAERVKTVLAMVATTTAGGKASIDSHWFDAQSRYAVVTQMNALRATQLTIIEQGMKENLQGYSLEQGLRDVQTYFDKGSVVAALQEIATSAGTQSVVAKQTLKFIRQQKSPQ